jgi:hypothetical protein
MAALIACGNGFGGIEVFSPDGRCSQNLGNNPVGVNNLTPALGYINGKITACTRYPMYFFSKNTCATYNPATSTWTDLTTVPTNHSGSPGTVHILTVSPSLFIINY